MKKASERERERESLTVSRSVQINEILWTKIFFIEFIYLLIGLLISILIY